MARVIAFVAAFVAAFAVASGAGASTTVVRGVVMRGPVMPVCVEARPCSAPVAFATIVFSRGSVQIARASSNRSGRFSLRLPAGAYGVRVLGLRPPARVSPRGVRVPASGPIWLRLDVDTGIR